MTEAVCSTPGTPCSGETAGRRQGGTRPHGEEALRSGATPHLNTVVLHKREQDKSNDHFQSSANLSQRESVCLVYTQGFASTLLSMTSVSGSWTAPCAVQQGLAARPPHGSAHLLTLPPRPPRRHRPHGSHESVLCACRGGCDGSD